MVSVVISDSQRRVGGRNSPYFVTGDETVSHIAEHVGFDVERCRYVAVNGGTISSEELDKPLSSIAGSIVNGMSYIFIENSRDCP